MWREVTQEALLCVCIGLIIWSWNTKFDFKISTQQEEIYVITIFDAGEHQADNKQILLDPSAL